MHVGRMRCGYTMLERGRNEVSERKMSTVLIL